MTGDLRIYRDDKARIIESNSLVTIGTSTNNGTTASTELGGLYVRDSDPSKDTGVFRTVNNIGRVYSEIYTKNCTTAGTIIANSFKIGVEKDGSMYYNVTDSTAFKNAIGAVNKNGDSMTGDLSISGKLSVEGGDITGGKNISDNVGHLRLYLIKSVNLLNANNGLSSTGSTTKYIHVQDINDKNASFIATTVNGNGNISTNISVRNWTSGGIAIDNGLTLTVGKTSGSFGVGVSSGAASYWRTAIGAAASSSRLTKYDIEDITEEEAKKILDIDVKSFQYKEGFVDKSDIKDTYYGVIAEDILDKIPYVVNVPEVYSEETFDESLGKDQPLITVDYVNFVPYLLKVVQIQQKEIDELKDMVNELKSIIK